MSKLNQLYVDLSTYYDHFCRHIDYVDQCAFANRVYDLFNESNLHKYFDLACGTGQHLKFMHDYGFEVSGLDNSQAMLDQALIRCPRNISDLIDKVENEDEALSFNSRWYYRGEGEVLDLFLDIQRKTENGVQDWNDHHTMTAVEIPQVKNWMNDIGFQVTLLERDFQKIKEWNGESANVLVIGLKV